MEFGFTPEEEAFRWEVSDFLDKEGPADWHEKRVTFFDASGQEDWIRIHRGMAQKLGSRGWLSMHWPVEYGGKGVSPLYRLILREELARHLRVLAAGLLSLTLAQAFDLYPDLVALAALPIALGSLIMTLTVVLDMQTREGDDSPRCLHLWKS